MSFWTRIDIYKLLLDDVLDDGTIDPRATDEKGQRRWKVAQSAERCAKSVGNIGRLRRERGLKESG